jgi:3-oxoacyl-[acyl-carrier protein] reductase
MELRDSNVIVTGGAKGIGRALTEELLRRGSSVCVLDNDTEVMKELAGKGGEKARYIECDVTDLENVKQAVSEVSDTCGGIDAVVNNAAMIYSAPLVSLVPGAVKMHDPVMWDKVIHTDLSGVFYVTSAVVEKMIATRTRGVIVNISSVAASGNPGQGAYSAAKAGVRALTSVWSKELAPFGIRAACIAPGFTGTETTRKAMQENVLKEWIRKTPSKRLGEVDEIVQSVIFALENDFFNGKTLEVDGGLTL